MILKKKRLALLMALIMLVALFASCAPRTEEPEEEDRPPRPPIEVDDDTPRIHSITPDFAFEIETMYQINDHVVGWLQVPGTNIEDVVVFNPDCIDNNYYLRRNIYREFYFDGIFYGDIRSNFGPTRDYLGVNTCIYGHAMTDDPTSQAFDIMFGQLHKFRDPEFARYHPYIFFSTPEDNIAFEIFAVFYGNVDNPAFAYNTNPANPEDFVYIIENTVIPRSLFFFDDVHFDANDRFITLSTCIYNPTGGVTLLGHRYTMYRFAIMARMMDPDEPLREYVNITINEDRIVDPEGRWRG